MKKIIAVLSLFTGMALANEPATQSEDNVPKLYFGVFDTSNSISKEVGLQYSVSNKHHQLCWTAFNMPFSVKNNVVETFKSPAKSKFRAKGASVVSSADKKTHTITANLPSSNGEFLMRCWAFNKTDPLGKYQVSVHINDITFETQTFELIK